MKFVFTVKNHPGVKFDTIKEARNWCEKFDPTALITMSIIET